MSKPGRILDFITNVISAQVSGWLLVAMSIIVMIEVISRYALRHPLMVADELSGYSLVLISFLGLAYTWKEKGHINIRVLTNRLPTRVARWIRVVSTGMIVIFLPLLIKGALDVNLFMHKTDARGFSTIRLQTHWFEMFVIIGLVMFFIVLVVDFVSEIRLAIGKEKTNE